MPPFSAHYELLAPVGTGTTSVVSRAKDRATGHEVALKRLTLGDAPARLMFQHEYWTMRRLEHPGLVKALAYGRDDDAGDWLAMELVDGPGVATGPLEAADFASAIAPLCQTVAYLHAQGLVHGDLKPDNVRFDAEGRLRLLDLGFLQPAGRAGLRRGTLEYMGPEVIKGEPADPRSDVYALGVMAYAWLTGRMPFAAAHPLALLQAQLTETPAHVATLRPDLDPRVADTVMAALDKHPGHRPPSAGHFLARLGLGQADTAFLIFGSALVGRAGAVADLRRHVTAQRAGEEAALRLVGASGLGKTRLLAEVVEPGGPAVLAAAGQGDVPYRLVTALLEAAEPLMAERGLDARDGRWQALRALMPHWGEPPAGLDPRNQENRLRQAAMVLVSTLAEGQGLVVAIDDWDLADRASRDLLAVLLRRPNEAQLAWVLVSREAEAADAPTLTLAPLEEEAVAELLTSVLDQVPAPELLRAAADRAAGNPAHLREILRHWQAAGALTRVADQWHLDAARAGAVSPAGADAALPACSPAARQLAEAGAVLGHAFSLADAAALVAGDLFEPLAELEAAGVLTRQGERGQFLGLAREAALAGLEAEPARALHARAAMRFADRTDLAGLTQAARHRLHADPAAAGEAVLAAVRANMAHGALATARELLEAYAGAPMPDATRQEVERLLGDLARMTGQGAAALGHYDAAIALARTLDLPAALARELVSAGRTAMMLSKADEARAYLEEALPLTREQGQSAQEARALMTLGRVSYFAGDRTAAREAYETARAVTERAGERALMADALSLLGILLPIEDPASLASLEAAVALHREVQNPLGLIDALINLGDRRMAKGELAAAEAIFLEAQRTCRQVGSFNEEAFVLLNLSETARDQGQALAARQAAERAHALASELNQPFPAGYALAYQALACLKLGDYATARRAVAESLRLAAETQVKYLEVAARFAETQLLLELGEADDAERAIEATRAVVAMGDPAGLSRLGWLEGRLSLLRGDAEAARTHLQAALDQARQQGVRLVVSQAQLDLARAQLRAKDAAGARGWAEPARAEAVAMGAADLAAEAERLMGEAERLDGHPDAARGDYAEAIATARRLGLPLLEALASLGMAEVATGGAAAEFRMRGERLMRQLAAEVNREAFFRWSERRLEAAPAAGPAVGLAEAIAFWHDMRASGTTAELLNRLLERMMGVSRAEAGALLSYRAMQLDAVATQFVKEEQVATSPLLDDALWDHRAVFEPSRWALPVLDGEELVAVLYLEAPDAARREVVVSLCEGLGAAIGQFVQLQRFQEQAERLAFSESLAKQALYGRAPAEILTAALEATLAITAADRALLLRVGPTGEPALAMGLDKHGQALPPDTAFSRSISGWVISTRETVRLMDAQQMEQWQHQQSILALGLHTIVAVPLVGGEAVSGVLYVDSADVVNLLGEREQGLLEAAAEVIAPLLDRR